MTTFKSLLGSCMRAAALLLLPCAAAQSQTIDNAAAYALADQISGQARARPRAEWDDLTTTARAYRYRP